MKKTLALKEKLASWADGYIGCLEDILSKHAQVCGIISIAAFIALIFADVFVALGFIILILIAVVGPILWDTFIR